MVVVSTHKVSQYHPFHIVERSPWPLLMGVANGQLFLSFVLFFMVSSLYFNGLLLFYLLLLLGVFYGWSNDIIDEASFEFNHTKKVQTGIIIGFVCFLISEFMFFFCFFSSFFDVTLSPVTWIGGCWPPIGFLVLNAWALPFGNTILLLISAVMVTVSHRAIVSASYRFVFFGLVMTVGYGLIFLICQYAEYVNSTFSFFDSVFGSIFYLGTGFHGFHVLIGLIFLLICLIRHYNYQFAAKQHVGLELAIWYWHFVDVIWLFLFIVFYWWGMGGSLGIDANLDWQRIIPSFF